MKNIFLSLILLISFIEKTHAFAPDSMANDMLTSVSEDENRDAISRWGVDSKKKKNEAPDSLGVNRLQPISDSSFEVVSNRAPASVRGPASSVDGVIVQKSDEKSAPKALVRTLVKKKAYQEVSVIANDLGFFPSTLIVTQGIPVRIYITGASERSQCFMLDAFGVRRQIRSQKIEEITFTPDQSGNYAFTCPMNGAKGSLVVKELDLAGARMPASVEPASEEDKTETANNE